MATKTRLFNGKKYRLWDYGLDRRPLDGVANSMQRDGIAARVVIGERRGNKVYELYIQESISPRQWLRFGTRNLFGRK